MCARIAIEKYLNLLVKKQYAAKVKSLTVMYIQMNYKITPHMKSDLFASIAALTFTMNIV